MGGTDTTRGPVKPNAEHWIPRDIAPRPPVDTGMPLRIVGLLGIPIQHKCLQGIALSGLMLTAIRPKGRTHHIDLILVLRGHEEVGIHGAAVEKVPARQQIAHGSVVRNGGSHDKIRRAGGRGEHLGDQIGLPWVTSLAIARL